MGYVWCDGYVWDMCGVRYANNLLKNPATKRLSGKTCQSRQMAQQTSKQGAANGVQTSFSKLQMQMRLGILTAHAIEDLPGP